MARGQLLYRDVWEQRPPAIYWTYLGALELFGWRASTVALLDLLATAGTTAFIWLIGHRLASQTVAATAAFLFAAFTMPAALYGHGGFLERAVSETFISLLVSALAWSAIAWLGSGSRASAAAIGLAAGAAVAFKPNAGLYLAGLMTWAAIYRTHARGLASALVIAGLTALVVPALTLLWLWRLDLLHDAKIAVVDFNRYYVGEGFELPAYALVFSKAVWLRIKTEPLWLAGAAGAVVAVWDLCRRRALPPLAGLTVIWGATAVAVIVVNGARLYNSYFIQALPPLALLAAWLLTDAAQRSKPRRVATMGVIVLMGVLVVKRNLPARVFEQAAADLGAVTGRIDRLTYLERFGGYDAGRGYSARANAELADYIRTRIGPDDRIFLFGINGAGVYFDADRLTAHRFLRVNFFIETDFPDPAFTLEAVVTALQRTRPRLVVFETLHISSLPAMARRVDALATDPVLAPLLVDYERTAQIEDFTVYERTRR